MPRKYPPLLPAPALSHSTSESSAPDNSDEPSKRKRVGVQVACNNCRVKKTRCDGGRPCAPCTKRRMECVYSDKREINDESSEVVELLKSTPEGTAFDILRLLRASGDPAAVLSMVKGGMDGKMRPSDLEVARTMAVPSKSMLEFELMAKNFISYPLVHPVADSTLEQSNLLRPMNLGQKVPDEQMALPSQAESRVDADSAAGSFRDQVSLGKVATHVDRLCDDRLRSLDVSFWTTVPVPSELAAKAISLYLETDHPLLGIFDPELFVADLVGHQQASCSSLLVNALLYWAFMYSAIEKSANEYTAQFSVEAERLWSEEKRSDSALNIAGAQILSLAFMGDGRDHDVLHYLAEAVKMGTRMGFLGVDEKTAAAKLGKLPERAIRSASFAAWGVFNWTVLLSLFYQQPGLQYPDLPPMLPIPGDYETDRGRNDSGTSASTPAAADMPPYMGTTLPALCKFWRIVHGVSLVYFSGDSRAEWTSLRLEFAEFKYRELLAWIEGLPSQLTRDDENPHHVVVFHMWFHAAILDIFRPFLRRQQPEDLRLRTFATPNSTPVAAYWASVSQLKSLVVQYRSNYRESTYSILWHTALMYVSNAVLQDTNDPQWRHYILLCIYGYENLRRSFRISEAIGRGLLTMTLRDRMMTSQDARQVMRQLKERGLSTVRGAIRATFMGDLELAQTDPVAATVEMLADNFENMALFREFVNEGPDDQATRQN